MREIGKVRRGGSPAVWPVSGSTIQIESRTHGSDDFIRPDRALTHFLPGGAAARVGAGDLLVFLRIPQQARPDRRTVRALGQGTAMRGLPLVKIGNIPRQGRGQKFGL